jgi:ComF family protein
MSTVLQTLRASVRPFVEFVFPPTCFICDSLTSGTDSRICNTCWSAIEPVTEEDPLYLEMNHRLTGREGPTIEQLIPLYHFEKDGTLQAIIHQLKYDAITSFGVELGRKLGGRIRERVSGHAFDGIVPVPLHPTKLRERGYNQSEYIARGVREVIGIPIYSSLLRRHKYTTSQTHLTAAERRENVNEAFDLNKHYLLNVAGRRFLIVDDVITTGATTEACARVLKLAGASSVAASSVALAEHALP